MSIAFSIARENWPIAGAFTISRGSKTSAQVVVVTLERGDAIGRGECVPYPRYGETVESVVEELESVRPKIEDGLEHEDIPQLLNSRAARNAVDCALWDLKAKDSGRSIWQLLALPEPRPLLTAYTLSLDSPQAMASAAIPVSHLPLLKLKLGQGATDPERLKAVRKAAPEARLIVDANEGWKPSELQGLLEECAMAKVELVEQPLSAAEDSALLSVQHLVPVCADESVHEINTLDGLVGKYDIINIKLDKTGGLTAALALQRAAMSRGLGVMTGCMVSTSLSIAPAMVVAQQSKIVDLDGPLLLKKDRVPGLRYDHSTIYPPPPSLWG